MSTIDLVADLGEGYGAWTMGADAQFLRIVSSANVACGYHAGDPRTMDATVAGCVERGVAIGAHPSFPDRVGFGRRAMELSAEEVRTDVLFQLGALSAFTTAHATRISHLCPHGKLGNLSIVRADYAEALVAAVCAFDPRIAIYTQPGETAKAAEAAGLPIVMVGNIDRSYEADGTLTPRTIDGAVLHEPEVIAERALRMVTEGTVVCRTGEEIENRPDSLLLHSDGPDGLAIAHHVRQRLEAAGVSIVAPVRGAR